MARKGGRFCKKHLCRARTEKKLAGKAVAKPLNSVSGYGSSVSGRPSMVERANHHGLIVRRPDAEAVEFWDASGLRATWFTGTGTVLSHDGELFEDVDDERDAMKIAVRAGLTCRG
jgi:hypothetical protein